LRPQPHHVAGLAAVEPVGAQQPGPGRAGAQVVDDEFVPAALRVALGRHGWLASTRPVTVTRPIIAAKARTAR
jgi:hypothetical protein